MIFLCEIGCDEWHVKFIVNHLIIKSVIGRQIKSACLTVNMTLASDTCNFLALACHQTSLLVDGHARVMLLSYRVHLLLLRWWIVTMMFISCKMLLILLETVCSMPYRLPRLIWKTMDALCRPFRHKRIQTNIYRFRRVLPRHRALAQNPLKLLMLISPLNRGWCAHNLKLFAVLRGYLDDAGWVFGVDTLFILAVLGDAAFRNGQTPITYVASIEIHVGLWAGADGCQGVIVGVWAGEECHVDLLGRGELLGWADGWRLLMSCFI